ncbi:hypothetical protein PUMCH_003260 [Australozyma saopauloensis]|uniref:DNA-directed RNA polymerase I subunit RPA49 n=1 Tax=Australozyma saopauloensis TaxID=291208 RepID=A0AAX4HBJ9_9ASCO|nr:hypothetical protein PUMCH_003260 [[Candida] saopauloensis]
MGKKDNKTTELKVVSCSKEPEFVVGSFFNGLQIPESTEFDLYKHKHHKGTYALHGENSTLEYNGETQADLQNDYLVAFYDKKSRSVQLFRAPVVPAVVTSKENRVHKGPKVRSKGMRSVEQRNALGREFGTKKVKAKITSYDKNRIDSNRLEEMEVDIVDTVQSSTSVLPSRQELESASAVSAVTPAVNALATNVEDVYSLESIIPSEEWESIRVHAIMEESDKEQRLEMLPYSKSAFVSKKLSLFISAGKTTKVQMLFYAALLFGVYANRRCNNKNKLMEQLDNKPSEILVDGVLDRFTAAKTSGFGKAKDRSFVIDPFHEDKLLCFLLALTLHIEDFQVQINPLANELNMKPTRLIGLFRALGATIKPANAGMAEALGLSKRDAATYKVAVLKVPFKQPEMVRRRVR